jgi:argonaute-like protein implicated in RNA metabolism and viral defense
MHYLIDIHWTRTSPHPDKPSKGHSSYFIRDRSLTSAKVKAVKKFTEQYGNNFEITEVCEKSDPARIFTR